MEIRNNLRILRNPIVSVIQADTSPEALEGRLAKLEKTVREIQKSVDMLRKR